MAAHTGATMSELQDLTALIRANTPLIVIETADEARVVNLFRQALLRAAACHAPALPATHVRPQRHCLPCR